jgi:hypothetical protein
MNWFIFFCVVRVAIVPKNRKYGYASLIFPIAPYFEVDAELNAEMIK